MKYKTILVHFSYIRSYGGGLVRPSPEALLPHPSLCSPSRNRSALWGSKVKVSGEVIPDTFKGNVAGAGSGRGGKRGIREYPGPHNTVTASCWVQTAKLPTRSARGVVSGLWAEHGHLRTARLPSPVSCRVGSPGSGALAISVRLSGDHFSLFCILWNI